MRKNKAKTASQKRRARAKAKSRLKEEERENWVENRLDWVHISGFHEHDLDDELDDKPGDEVGVKSTTRNDDVENLDSKTFVEKIHGESGEDIHTDPSEEPLHDFSIISWNVLADAYCSRSSHKNLPSKFQTRVFNRNQRQHQVRQTLRLIDNKLSPDLIALQEVDPPLEGKGATNALVAWKTESSFQS